MEETLEQFLQRIFGGKPAWEPIRLPVPTEAESDWKNPACQALDHFQRSLEMLRLGK